MCFAQINKEQKHLRVVFMAFSANCRTQNSMCTRLCKMCANTFTMTSSKLIPLQLSHIERSPFFRNRHNQNVLPLYWFLLLHPHGLKQIQHVLETVCSSTLLNPSIIPLPPAASLPSVYLNLRQLLFTEWH